MRTTINLAFLGGLLLLLASCTSNNGGTAPFSYAGSWSGTIQDSLAGPGTISATLTQSGSDLGGTWQASFTSGSNGGSAVGFVNGNEVLLELHPSSVSACPYNVVATRSGNTLSGNYSAFNGTGTITGTISMTKQ